MNKFLSRIVPYMEIISETEEKGEELVAKAKKEAEDKAFVGCSGMGCLFFIFGLPTIVSLGINSAIGLLVILLMTLLPFILGCIIDGMSVEGNKKTVEDAVENAKLKAIEMNRKVERNFKLEIKSFMDNNPL